MNKKEFIVNWSKQVYEGNVKQVFIIDDTAEFTKYLDAIIRDEVMGFAYWVYVTKQDLNGHDERLVDKYLDKESWCKACGEEKAMDYCDGNYVSQCDCEK